MPADKYAIGDAATREPPSSFFQKIKFLGPGFILSASIVGSGELIATTTLGARAGFVAFWIIIVSCLLKVAVQLEFGREAILTGRTAMHSLNTLHNPRKKNKANGIVWTVFILLSLKIVQIGGILGATAIVLSMLFTYIPIYIWVFFIAGAAASLIYKGYYRVIEKVSLVMISIFTVCTIGALFMLRYTEFSFSLANVYEGLQFRLPSSILAVAFGAFGITGVGADEIIAYNYWCIEKGYAAYTGPPDDSDQWRHRARGWINVMYLDALVAMIVYTLVTAAFFLLGAAVLHGKSIIPEGNQVIESLALIYTKSLGPGVKTIYLLGAFFVLFSSVFASLAAWTRVFPDIFGQVGWINFANPNQRKKIVRILAWTIPVIWAITYLFIELPVMMILTGGIIGSIMLFVVVYAAAIFLKRRDKVMAPGFLYNVAFFISAVSIIAIGVYGLIQLFSG